MNVNVTYFRKAERNAYYDHSCQFNNKKTHCTSLKCYASIASVAFAIVNYK